MERTNTMRLLNVDLRAATAKGKIKKGADNIWKDSQSTAVSQAFLTVRAHQETISIWFCVSTER